jgi:hypothetical protein
MLQSLSNDTSKLGEVYGTRKRTYKKRSKRKVVSFTYSSGINKVYTWKAPENYNYEYYFATHDDISSHSRRKNSAAKNANGNVKLYTLTKSSSRYYKKSPS